MQTTGYAFGSGSNACRGSKQEAGAFAARPSLLFSEIHGSRVLESQLCADALLQIGHVIFEMDELYGCETNQESTVKRNVNWRFWRVRDRCEERDGNIVAGATIIPLKMYSKCQPLRLFGREILSGLFDLPISVE
ncbi:hypothetical protein [Burkholderia territorii]|uniref:hypothetical protein n=1 Tax=Burkholderia territorii TaxID=1503055 RepID=UPI0012D94108|nr:hypothetical protein [Burkholderia territorii]